jgi:hypothetical protein
MSGPLTDEDYYEITVEPVNRILTLIFHGPHWSPDVCKYVYNDIVAQIIFRYRQDWKWFQDREESMDVVRTNRHQYSWCWDKREVNIKGDG